MNSLEVRFPAKEQISSELEKQINELDHLAFSVVPDEEDLASIQWSDGQWMALGFLDGELVSQLSLVDRRILVGGTSVHVAGIGGVATAPQWQHKGLAAQLLRQTSPFLKNTMKVPFGLLICADKLQSFYSSCGWIKAAVSLDYQQSGQNRTLKTMVMILPLGENKWPDGKIDVCGSPW
jgi:predicted GNAT family N-acyltransferase